jgi:aminoglycoside N3'-acetyltransferase
MINKESIIQDLENIGIKRGDILFITADLLKVGYFNKNRNQTLLDWLQIFDEVLGEDGTLVMAAYTDVFFRFCKKRDTVFTRFAKSNVGSIANALINDKSAYRSTHATNSCIAKGKNAKEITENHTVNSLSYSIIGDIIKRDGKFLMLGTLDNKNAPQAMHYVQETLGYTKWSPYKYLYQTYYYQDNKVKIFTKKDFGGCSKGGRNLYGYLIEQNQIKFQNIGNAPSALMKAKESFEIIYSVLKQKKNIIQCTDKQCIDCYGNFKYNGLNTIVFIFSYFFDRIISAKNKSSELKQ